MEEERYKWTKYIKWYFIIGFGLIALQFIILTIEAIFSGKLFTKDAAVIVNVWLFAAAVFAIWKIYWFFDSMKVRSMEKRFLAGRGIITREKILDEWTTTLDGAAGRGEKLIDAVGRAIQKADIPDTMLAMRDASVEEAERRPFLLLASTAYKGIDMYVGAHDYGSRLAVEWYAVSDTPEEMYKLDLKSAFEGEEQNLLLRWLDVKSRKNWVWPSRMNKDDKETLNRCIALARKTVREEVERFDQHRTLDFSEENTLTRGFANYDS